MNEKQRSVTGTLAIALIVAALFYIPWRIESSGDLRWAPFYRNPVISLSTLSDDTIQSRFVRLKGRPVIWLYLLQLGAIGATGAAAYWYVRDLEA
jgi:hypothetical protein